MDPEFGTAAIAIYTGDIGALKDELAAHPELVTKRSSCSHPTLLQFIACDGNDIVEPVASARLLVELGAETWPPVVAAAGCNTLAVLEFLIDHGAAFDRADVWNPLEEALYWSNDETVELLLRRGAKVRSLAAAAGLGDEAALDRLLDGDLLHADAGPIRSPFAETVPEHLASDPASIVDHAFVMAVNCGQTEAAVRLLAAGARVNEAPPGYHWQGTALHAAAWRGDREPVAWLLSVGADPTVRDGLANSDFAGWATHHGHPELLELL